jgi:hypothetical protein
MPGHRKFDRYADSLTQHATDAAIVRRVCPFTEGISGEATRYHCHSELAMRGDNLLRGFVVALHTGQSSERPTEL